MKSFSYSREEIDEKKKKKNYLFFFPFPPLIKIIVPSNDTVNSDDMMSKPENVTEYRNRRCKRGFRFIGSVTGAFASYWINAAHCLILWIDYRASASYWINAAIVRFFLEVSMPGAGKKQKQHRGIFSPIQSTIPSLVVQNILSEINYFKITLHNTDF